MLSGLLIDRVLSDFDCACYPGSEVGFYPMWIKGSELSFAISTGEHINSFPATNNELDRAIASRYPGMYDS